MLYSTPFGYLSSTGIVVYNNSNVLMPYLYAVTPCCLSYIHNKYIKYVKNRYLINCLETTLVSVNIYSLYKSSSLFEEIFKNSRIPTSFITYITYNFVKVMSSLQFYRLFLYVPLTSLTYSIFKYVEYQISKSNRIQTYINYIYEVIHEFNTMCNNLVNAINNNTNYDVSINGYNIRGISYNRGSTTPTPINMITRENIEMYAPLRCNGLNNVITDYYKPENCSICFTEFNDNTLHRILQCKHAFHSHCIDEWLYQNTCCPICRSNIIPIIPFPLDFEFNASDASEALDASESEIRDIIDELI
jgi:hypothetical protein